MKQKYLLLGLALFFFLILFSATSLALILGDFGSANNGPPDGVVDFEDLMIFAMAYGTTSANANWNPTCDIAGQGSTTPDGVIDFEDLMIFALHYGEIGIIIPDTTKIADEDTELQLASVSQDQSEITFVQSTPQLEELQEGDILFIGVTDQTPYGLLRKVTSIKRGSKLDDTLTLSTEFTSIEEAVEELHVSVDIVLTQDDIDYEKLRLPSGVSISQDRGGFGYEHTFNLSDVSPIYVGDPATTIDDVTIDGEINLNYEMIFNLDIGWFNLDVEFRNIVESYTDLNVTVGGSLSLSDLLDPNPIHLFTIPFVPIPVAPLLVITPVIYINIGLDGEIHAELTVGVIIDQTGDNRLESGFEYNKGQWHSIKNSPVFDLEPKIPVLNLGGTIKPYVGPQLELIFNGCAGVYGSLYGYLELQADINDDPWWCLYGGFEGIIGAQLKILSFDLGDPVEWTIFNPDSKLLCCADGPFININHPPIISSLTADPPSIDINQTTSITCTASDEDVGDILTYTWTKNGGTFEGSTAGPTITWRAPSTQGNYTITCEVSDGEASDSEQVIISVGDVNHAPEITSDPVTSATKDEPYSYDVNATDPDVGDTLTYSLTVNPTGMNINSSTGVITWTPTSTGDYDVTVKVSDNGSPVLSDTQSFTIVVSDTQPDSANKLFLQSGGALNGTSINPSNPILTVNIGESITGTLKVQAIYSGPSNNVVPFGYTPSWGSHSSSYVTVKSSLPVGTATYNVPINFNAPSTPGTYYLIFATSCEMNLGWTMSRTNWTTGTMSWDDGKDIADLTESNLGDSLSTGYLYLDMLEGSTYKKSNYGITYVKIIVTENGTYDLRDIGPAGGYIFYDKGSYSDGWRYLETAPASTEWTDKQWGSYGTFIGGTGTCIGTGQSNTTKIVTWLNSHSETDRAAQLCDSLVYGGYSDWFLPSKDELNLMYTNLKVYGVGGFTNSFSCFYWSSSEDFADRVFCQSFCIFGDSTDGIQSHADKTLEIRVRAVRTF